MDSLGGMAVSQQSNIWMSGLSEHLALKSLQITKLSSKWSLWTNICITF